MSTIFNFREAGGSIVFRSCCAGGFATHVYRRGPLSWSWGAIDIYRPWHELIESVVQRAQLWGEGDYLDPATLRSVNDWGVAWQLWRCWYELSTPVNEKGERTTGWDATKYYTSLHMSSEVAELMAIKYDDPMKDMNWCRFLMLLTSSKWNAAHAPMLSYSSPVSAFNWLLYVGNAPRKDVVYTADLPRCDSLNYRQYCWQSTVRWFVDMKLTRARISKHRPSQREVTGGGKSPRDVLRAYQLMLERVPKKKRDSLFRGLFADHVLEFEL